VRAFHGDPDCSLQIHNLASEYSSGLLPSYVGFVEGRVARTLLAIALACQR
jgi:hypothetical protein